MSFIYQRCAKKKWFISLNFCHTGFNYFTTLLQHTNIIQFLLFLLFLILPCPPPAPPPPRNNLYRDCWSGGNIYWFSPPNPYSACPFPPDPVKAKPGGISSLILTPLILPVAVLTSDVLTVDVTSLWFVKLIIFFCLGLTPSWIVPMDPLWQLHQPLWREVQPPPA